MIDTKQLRDQVTGSSEQMISRERLLALLDEVDKSRALLDRVRSAVIADQQSAITCLTVGAPVLTKREIQVIELLVQGQSNKLIADKLGLSEHTAKFHVNNVLKKFGVTTRSEVIVGAIKCGVVTV